MNNRSAINIELDFTNQLISKVGPDLEKVILFGSRAKGTPKSWSDYDMLIVTLRKNRKLVDTIYDLVMDFLLNRRVDISLKIYNKEQFAKKGRFPTPFMKRIQATGVTLWSRP